MKGIIFKSFTIALLISILTAVLSTFIQPVKMGEGNILKLQLTMISFEALIFFIPIFIGCICFGLWESKERIYEKYTKRL